MAVGLIAWCTPTVVKSNALGPKMHMYGPREIHNYILPRIHKANGQSPTANPQGQRPIAQSIKPSINQAINQSSHQSTRPIGHKAPKPTGHQDESIKLPSPKAPSPKAPSHHTPAPPHINTSISHHPKREKSNTPRNSCLRRGQQPTALPQANGITSGQRHYLRPTATIYGVDSLGRWIQEFNGG